MTREPAIAPARRRSRWRPVLVLGAVLLVLVGLRIATSGGTVSLTNAVQDFVTLSLSVVIESLPFVILGVLISTVVQLWVPDRWFFAILPRNGVLRRGVLSLLGVLLPVCECGNVPLARGLVVRGLSVPEAMTFLLAAPILNPITIVTTVQAFGWGDGIVVWRILGGFLIANFVGWLLTRHPHPDAMLTPDFQAACAAHAHDADDRTHRLSRGARMVTAEMSAVLPALFVGSALAGLIQVAISREVLVGLGGDPVLSVLALMALAFVVAMCSNVDAFFVLSLGSTFSPGAIVAFLVFGPMIDVKMLALMRTTFTARTLLIVTGVVALFVAALGLGLNLAR
ncbi:permease [Schumannella sp. 10F1B-5-1]|uniref:permease n=1 Tax=Schumannella sp. 10F1B-5-1 TaxID=2590780 RepID=UPI00351A0CA0